MGEIDLGCRDEVGQPAAADIKVSVVIPHFQDLRSLDICLTALCQQTYPRADFEIIVADNASPIGAQAVESAIAGRARLVIVPERGAGPARNGGVAVASGAVLAFTDADCVPEPNWLAGGLEALSNYDFVGGRMKVLVDNVNAMTPAESFEYLFAFNNARYVLRKGFSVTACLFCRRDVFEEVGGFRVGVSEDVEWSQRASRAGFRLGYASKAVVGHPARKNWEELKKKWDRMNKETYNLYKMKKNGWAIYAIRTLSIPMSAIIHTPRILFGNSNLKWSEKISTIGILYRLRFWRTAQSIKFLTGIEKS